MQADEPSGLRRWVGSAQACWKLFLEVNRNPDILPAWPSTAIGRLLWAPVRWLGRGAAIVLGAALGALLGVEADRGVGGERAFQYVWDSLGELLEFVAVAVGVAGFLHAVVWVCRFFLYAGKMGAHRKTPREVVERTAGAVLLALVVLAMVSALTPLGD